MTRGMIDAVVLSGGSLYGLDAAGGVTAVLCRQGKGAQFGGLTLPVAVQAILFDLMNGGEKDWLTAARRQAAALLGSRPRRRARGCAGFRAGHGGRGLWRHHGHRQGRAGLGKRAHATGLHCRCIGGGERRRLGADRRWPAFLGRALRAGRRVRRPGLAAEDCARGARRALQGPAGAGDGDHHRHGRDRCHAHQGRVQAARHHGQRRPVEGAAAGARAQRRRHGVRGRHRPRRAPPGWRSAGADRARHGCGRLPRPGRSRAACTRRRRCPTRPRCPTGRRASEAAGDDGISGGVRGRGHRRRDPARHEHLGGASPRHALSLAHLRHQHLWARW